MTVDNTSTLNVASYAPNGGAPYTMVSGGTFTAQQMRLSRYTPTRAMRVTKLVFTVAAGTGDDPVAACIYDQFGTRIATSGSVTGVTAAAGVKTVALLAPAVLNPGQTYYVGLQYNTIAITASGILLANYANWQAYMLGNLAPLVEADVSTQTFPPPATIAFSAAAAQSTVLAPVIALLET